MFMILAVILLGIIAIAVAPDLVAAVMYIGCGLLVLGGGLFVVLVVLVLTGVVQ